MIDSGPVDPSLLVHYTFDDAPNSGVLDSSGYNNHGTCIGRCPDLSAGTLDQAYNFDGTVDGIEVPDLRPAQLTVSAWVFRTADTPQQNIIGKAFGPQQQNSWQLIVDGLMGIYNPAWCSTQQDTVGDCAGPFSVVTLSTWHHVAFVHDGIRPRGYFNGVEYLGSRPVMTVGYDAHPILIGVDFDDGAYVARFVGRIDDIRIYDRALSVAEVQRLVMRLEP